MVVDEKSIAIFFIAAVIYKNDRLVIESPCAPL